ncbi:hypothetical protein [Kitasatospora sp. MBT66]|uniref:hypothetical protein n=1 Tax=Kitasatospora sp. MBT66 TaxID=1444769 RepID=UPI0005BC4EDB|nr:hypothetical protein [Kitasatospora sp. MBT66]
MILLSLALTIGGLGVLTCIAVAVARARGGTTGSSDAGGPEKILRYGMVAFVGVCLPMLFTVLGVYSGRPPLWLGLVHGVLVVAGVMLISWLMTRIRLDMWSDELLVGPRFLPEVLPVLDAAQQRAGGTGSALMEQVRTAIGAGRGRDALRYAVEIRALVEAADLPEHAAWTKVSDRILYWEEGHLPPQKKNRVRAV